MAPFSEFNLTRRANLFHIAAHPFFREGASVDGRQKLLANDVELMVTAWGRIYVLNAIF